MTRFLGDDRRLTVLNEYRDYLRHRVAPRSARFYYATVAKFLVKNEPDTVYVNNFISRSKRKAIDRAAFIKLYEMIGMPELRATLISYRKEQRKNPGHYIQKEKILKIIRNIEDPFHRLAARMQYDCGRRTSEIIAIDRTKMRHDKEGRIRFYVIGKGGMETYFYVTKATEDAFLKLTMKITRKHPFIRSKSKNMLSAIETNGHYYQDSVRKAKEKAGVKGFVPHDFRRNVADDLYEKHKDIRLVQKFLGHKRIATTEKYLADRAIDMKALVDEVRGGEE